MKNTPASLRRGPHKNLGFTAAATLYSFAHSRSLLFFFHRPLSRTSARSTGSRSLGDSAGVSMRIALLFLSPPPSTSPPASRARTTHVGGYLATNFDAHQPPPPSPIFRSTPSFSSPATHTAHRMSCIVRSSSALIVRPRRHPTMHHHHRSAAATRISL